MRQNLVDPTTANNISYIMNLLFDVLGIILIVFMIVTLVKLYRKIKAMMEND